MWQELEVIHQSCLEDCPADSVVSGHSRLLTAQSTVLSAIYECLSSATSAAQG